MKRPALTFIKNVTREEAMKGAIDIIKSKLHQIRTITHEMLIEN